MKIKTTPQISRLLPSMFLGLAVFAMGVEAAEPPVTALAFAPDGQSVIVGSQSGLSVRSWPQLESLRKLETELVNIHELAFSPGGKYLAAAGGTPAESGQVEVFSWPEGQSVHVCGGHDDSALGVAWNDDETLAIASLDHVITVWNASDWERKHELKGHSRGVSAVCFLPEANLLVSAGLDQNLRVWNVESETIVRTLNNHTREVHELAIRPNHEGLPMVASVSDDRTVRLWQPTIGRMVRFAQLDSIPLSVDWLTDGSLIVVATTDGHVLLIDPDTVEVAQDIPAVDGWAYSVAVHPSDGSLLVGGRHGQLVRITPNATTL